MNSLRLLTLGIFACSVSVATLLPRCQDDNDEECCLCYHGNSSCLPECPNGYFKVLQSVSCELEPSSSVTSNSTIDTSASTSAVTAATITTTNGSSTTATVSVNITTLVTTDVRLNISDDNVSTEVTSHSPSFPTTQMPPKPVVFVCIRNCPNGQFYNNISFKCDDCNEACINCTGPGSGNCDVCKYEYKGNCVVKCPDNTIRDQNGGNMCVDQPSDGTGGNGKSNIGGIVGGVVGSLAGIVVLGIVLFCYLRKKRTNCSGNQRGVSGKQTRHFRAIQEKDPEKGHSEKPKSSTSPRRPADYQNTNTIPAGTNLEQEIQRSHDKVTRYVADPTQNVKIQEQSKAKKSNSDSTDLQTTVYGNEAMVTIVQSRDTSTMTRAELEESLQLEEMGMAPAPPQPMSSAAASEEKVKKPKRKAKPPVADTEYMEMAGGEAKNSSHQDYENTNFVKDTNKLKNHGAKQTRTVVRPKVTMGSAPVNVHADTKGDDSGMEDYENTQKLKKPKDSEEEDYENVGAKKDCPDADLEDYENVNFEKK